MFFVIHTLICIALVGVAAYFGYRIGYNKGIDEIDDPIENFPGAGGNETKKHHK